MNSLNTKKQRKIKAGIQRTEKYSKENKQPNSDSVLYQQVYDRYNMTEIYIVDKLQTNPLFISNSFSFILFF